MSVSSKYQLEIIIKEGTFTHHCPHNSLYVETSIDGVVQEEDKTELATQENGRFVWNKTITKSFSTLEPATPVMISLSMYRKKRFKHGFQLIGTSHLSLSELIPILNKGTVQGKVQLNVKKNAPSTSTFLLALNLSSVSETPQHFTQAKATPSQDQPSKITVPNGNAHDIEAALNNHTVVDKGTLSTRIVVSSIVGPMTVLFLLFITAHMLSSSVHLFI